MREVCWLQVSDIHMRLRDKWQQDVVLNAMAASARLMRKQGLALDFILATGDLAFSGNPDEYKLVASFFDELADATGVPKARIFCIPGNHDVDRERQRLCFQGARSALTSPNAVDPVLAPDDNLSTLATRQQAYREFQNTYFGAQERTATRDGLAYVAKLTFEDVTIAVVGLNSAWLSEGGASDHGHLLIGERQALNAFETANSLNPHIVIGMAHHPLHLLREFDRNAVTRRIAECCDFFHCGHLHQPEARGAGFDPTACLMVAAGASFETRESQNAYSIVKLDLAQGTRKLTTVQYDPGQGGFVFTKEDAFPIRLSPASVCTVGELGEAIATFDAAIEPHSYYLAALLLEQKAEVPIPAQGSHVLGTVAVLLGLPEDDYCRKAVAFLHFRNALAVFCGRRPLSDILAQQGQAVRAYGAELVLRCQSDQALSERLSRQEADVRSLHARQPKETFATDLLAELALTQEWGLLREQAERQLTSPIPLVVIRARQMLALAMAHAPDDADRREAVRQYRALVEEGSAEPADRACLAALLHDFGEPDEAKRHVLESLERSQPGLIATLMALGQRLVAETGDREFRQALEAALAKRGNHD